MDFFLNLLMAMFVQKFLAKGFCLHEEAKESFLNVVSAAFFSAALSLCHTIEGFFVLSVLLLSMLHRQFIEQF